MSTRKLTKEDRAKKREKDNLDMKIYLSFHIDLSSTPLEQVERVDSTFQRAELFNGYEILNSDYLEKKELLVKVELPSVNDEGSVEKDLRSVLEIIAELEDLKPHFTSFSEERHS